MKIFKRLLTLIGIAILILLVFFVLKTFTFKSKQLNVAPVAKIDIPDAALERLSNAIQIKTISPENSADFDSVAFYQFNDYLKKTYPLVDSLLELKRFNEFTHLYKWQGSNEELEPIVLMAHLDVVPVIEKNLSAWKEAPFDGLIKNDTIWGRGTIDDKNGVIGILEATEMLLASGHQPERTMYFSFGHDEELGGPRGAKVVVDYLEENNIRPAMVLDEGLMITEGLVPGIDTPVALIGTSEKGSTSLELSVTVDGGHSSIPKPETAIDILSNAIAKLKQEPFPTEITPPLQGFIEYIGPEMPFTNKLVFANANILAPVLENIYSQSETGNALVRTTTSPTIFNAGVKENVIPRYASAIVNFRLLPGLSIDGLIAHVEKTIDDPRIEVKTSGDFNSTASEVSPHNTFAFETLHKTIKEIFPEAVVGPNLMVAGTDSKHFIRISNQVFRFSPFIANPETVGGLHGINEHITIKDFKNTIRFYHQLILNTSKE